MKLIKLLSITLLFASCSGSSNPIVGTWKEIPYSDTQTYTAVITYKPDSTFVWTEYKRGELLGEMDGTYELKDGWLYWDRDKDPDQTPKRVELNGDTLTEKWIDEVGRVKDETKFLRIN